MKGLILKKDRVFSVASQEITNLDYKETGRLKKKGALVIETHTKKEEFEGNPGDVKVMWREIQTHLGFHEALGAGEMSDTTTDPLKILDTRLAKGEISAEEYATLKSAMNH